MLLVEEMVKRVSGMSPEERVELGRAAYAELWEGLSIYPGVKREDIAAYIAMTVAVFAGADKVIAEEEKDIYNAITGAKLTLEEFREGCDLGEKPEEDVDRFDRAVDAGSLKVKYATCYLGLAIMAHDGVVNDAEKALLEKILAD